MTDTVNKQRLLEWLESELKNKDYESHVLDTLTTTYLRIKSGKFDSPPTTPVQGYREGPDIELALLQMWASHGIEEVYKYKHRVKAYHEGRHNTELFLDLTCGAQFPNIPDVANAHPTIPYHDITPEDCKVSVAELIRKRQALSQTDIQPKGADKIAEVYKSMSPTHTYGNAYRQGTRDTLTRLGIRIAGINSTEDDQRGPSISSTRFMLDGQLCGVCNEGVPLDHAQIGRLEADGTHTPYHMGCEGAANKLEPCTDCGHHRKFCSECAEPSTEEEETE
ncbi:hypothetical protein ACFSR7_12530 [Cohnella sp. GCM10020058]|uniref:hypothetical protein n=1 Tax=Cohnella sp. GCM10020058 TaxID=3317330 RepID=UPI00363AC976